jgi:hypothetical protein
MSIINSVISSVISTAVRSVLGLSVETATLINFIELERAANAYYSLSSDFVVGSGDDFSVSGYFVFSRTLDGDHLFADANGASRIAVSSGGEVFTAGAVVGTLSSTAFMVDGNQHFIYISRISGSFVFNVDGTTLLTAANTEEFRFNAVGKQRGTSTSIPAFDGIISKISLTHITTPANSLEFELNSLNTNTETNNGVTLTYQNIAGDVRWSSTLSYGAWLGVEDKWDGTVIIIREDNLSQGTARILANQDYRCTVMHPANLQNQTFRLRDSNDTMGWIGGTSNTVTRFTFNSIKTDVFMRMNDKAATGTAYVSINRLIEIAPQIT